MVSYPCQDTDTDAGARNEDNLKHDRGHQVVEGRHRVLGLKVLRLEVLVVEVRSLVSGTQVGGGVGFSLNMHVVLWVFEYFSLFFFLLTN